MQEEQSHKYDWQLPSYKPLHVGTNLGYRSQLVITPRLFPNQSPLLKDQPLNKSIKYNHFSKTLLQHLLQQFCVYRKFEAAEVFEYRELNHNFLKIGVTRMNTRAILNERLEGTDAYQVKSDLIFDSAFESGNLLQAYEVRDGVYHLVLQNDTDSLGFNSWFNFKVQNLLNTEKAYSFCIVNMRKISTLYKNGLLPMVYRKDIGWRRIGSRMRYFKNGLSRQVQQKEYVSLEWEYTLNPLEEVQFTNSIPYTVSDLHAFLSSVRALTKHVLLTRQTLGYSYLNNRIEIMTITDSQDDLYKKEILLMARVHPQQTIGSYIMEGVIKFLLADYPQSRQLLQNYKFHIIPMVNPDGVVMGNSRCSALGRDLNRLWTHPQLDVEPEISELKKYIRSHRKIAMVIDFHSQIKKKSCFMYGVHSPEHPYFTRQLPFVLSELNPDVFSFRECNFYCGMDANNTARKIVWEDLRIPVYSYECSSVNSNTNTHLNMGDYWKIAKDFLKALSILNTRIQPDYKQILIKFKKNGLKQLRQTILSKLKSKEQNYQIGLRNQYEDSDTEPEQDYAVNIPANKPKQTISMSIEQLSHKLKIEANLDRLMVLKKKQYANFLPQKLSNIKHAKDRISSQSYQKRLMQEMNKQSDNKIRYSQQKNTPERKRSPAKFKKLELSSDLHPHGILYTQMDSERDKIRGIINQSRSQHKKIQALRQENRKKQYKVSLQGHRGHQRILTLPNDLAPEYLRNLKKKRKSNLMDVINVARVWKNNIHMSEISKSSQIDEE